MKTLKVPKSTYNFYDSRLIKNTLSLNHKSASKHGNITRTLYGCYKLIRPMPLYAGLGDFIVLSECVKWLRELNQPPNKNEIRRCMMYFEPKLTKGERMRLVKTFYNPDTIGVNFKSEAEKKAKTDEKVKDDQFPISRLGKI